METTAQSHRGRHQPPARTWLGTLLPVSTALLHLPSMVPPMGRIFLGTLPLVGLMQAQRDTSRGWPRVQSKGPSSVPHHQ